MLSCLCVSVGGAIGSAARFWISGVVAQRYRQTSPDGTVTGSFIVRLFAAWLGHLLISMINKPQGGTMQIPKDAMLLRIFIGESKVIHYRHERPESQ